MWKVYMHISSTCYWLALYGKYDVTTVEWKIALSGPAGNFTTDPNSGDLGMELDFADPNSPDWDGELDEDDIFRRQRPHRLIMAHLYNTDE